MSMRRSLQQLLRQITPSAVTESCGTPHFRGYSRVPADFSQHYSGKFPVKASRRKPVEHGSSAAEASEASHITPKTEASETSGSASAAGDAAAPPIGPAPGTVESLVGETQRESARVATGFMFPWERRQMEGGKLKSWEKAYWGVFAFGMAIFLFNRLKGNFTEKEEPKVDEEREAKKAELARLILAGKSLIEDEEDLFKGMSPREIQEYISQVTKGAKVDDPFEGMSPEEINEYVAKHGTAAAAQ